jgi:hypothetical protein
MRMNRWNRSAGRVAFSAILLAAPAASAQTPAPAPAPAPAATPAPPAPAANCPPGSWFCADAQVPPAAPPGQPVPTPPPPSTTVTAPPGTTVVVQPAAPPPAPPPQNLPPPPPVRPGAPAPYIYRPAPEPFMAPREFGVHLRLDAPLLGNNRSNDASMGGFGVGLRYKPSPRFGLQLSGDFLGGTDYQGDRRRESALTVDGILYVNPRSRWQAYFVGGFGWAKADVRVRGDGSLGPASLPVGTEVSHSYFGGQLGFGLEWRLARHFALNTDLRGFVRGRTGSSQPGPEFRDYAGRSTNTSGGGLFTLGAVVYF